MGVRRFVYGLAVVLLVLGSTSIGISHPGRTDSNGGHNDRKNGGYHYHNGGPSQPRPDIDREDRTTQPDREEIPREQEERESEKDQGPVHAITANLGIYVHDLWGTHPCDHIREFEAFVSSMDDRDDDDGDGDEDILGVPNWVAYQMNRFQGTVPSYYANRPPWVTDEELFGQGVSPKDESYKNNRLNYSRGHLCMKRHACRVSKNAAKETFTFLNAVPQAQPMNNGIWKHIENLTASWADTYGTVWVICGPVYPKGEQEMIGQDDEFPVAVPTALYKIVVRMNEEGDAVEALAFVVPQENPALRPGGQSHWSTAYDQHWRSSSKSDPALRLTTIDEVEELTGMDFLTRLPDEVEDAVEKAKPLELWD